MNIGGSFWFTQYDGSPIDPYGGAFHRDECRGAPCRCTTFRRQGGGPLEVSPGFLPCFHLSPFCGPDPRRGWSAPARRVVERDKDDARRNPALLQSQQVTSGTIAFLTGSALDHARRSSKPKTRTGGRANHDRKQKSFLSQTALSEPATGHAWRDTQDGSAPRPRRADLQGQ